MKSRMQLGIGGGAEPETVLVESRAGFTLIEMLLTISIIALLAALTVGGMRRVGGKGKETRVRAALNELVTAIESYKNDVGSYPAANPLRPGLNPLFYELTGVVVDNEAGVFRSGQDKRVISPDLASALYGVEGFANAVTEASQVRNYLDLKSNQYGSVTNRAGGGVGNILVVPVPWPRNAAAPQVPPPGLAGVVDASPDLNPWHYVGPGSATNNQGSFDLWAEYVDGNDVRVLGNWRSDAYVDRPFVKR